jgi:hypothetical protein
LKTLPQDLYHEWIDFEGNNPARFGCHQTCHDPESGADFDDGFPGLDIGEIYDLVCNIEILKKGLPQTLAWPDAACPQNFFRCGHHSLLLRMDNTMQL